MLSLSVLMLSFSPQIEAVDEAAVAAEGGAEGERPPKRRKGSPLAGQAAEEAAAYSSKPSKAAKAVFSEDIKQEWRRFGTALASAERAAAAAEGGFAFAFVEGALVKAVREGHWLLLDEVHKQAHHTCISAWRLTQVLIQVFRG